MNRPLGVLVTSVFALLFAAGAAGQTSGSSTQEGAVIGASPTDNAKNIRANNTPGHWIQDAIARHNALIDARVDGARSGNTPTTLPSSGTGTGTGTGSTGTGSIGDLGSLLSGLLGGNSAGLTSGLGSLLGSVGNTVGNSSGGLSNLTGLLNGMTDAGSTSGTGGSTGSGGFTLDDLIRLRDTGTLKSNNAKSINDIVNAAALSSQNDLESQLQAALDAELLNIATQYLSKGDSRAQTTGGTGTATTPSFHARWLSAMTSTFFTALAVGFRSQNFITILEDSLRPVLRPDLGNSGGSSNTNDNTAANNNGNDNSAANGNSNSNSNANDNNNGGGIENQNANDNQPQGNV